MARSTKSKTPRKATKSKAATAKKPAGDQPQPTVTLEDLLKAGNEASGQARNMWLSFLVLLTYLVVALASITDRALLLNEQTTRASRG